MTTPPSPTDTSDRSPSPAATAIADTVGVLAFVALGRRTHDAGSAIRGTLEVAAPFLAALVLGWIVVRLVVRREPSSITAGTAIWAITLAMGMVLRRVLFDRGTALPFVIVATVFLALVLVARRAVVLWVRRR